MLKRLFVAAALSCAVLFLASCGSAPEPEVSKPPEKKAEAPPPKEEPEKKAPVKSAELQHVSLHVKDMTERLKLI
jgi:hypothetical protein